MTRSLWCTGGNEIWQLLADAMLQQGAPLSPREIQCLQFAAHGLTSADIGRKLGLVERTVNFHFSNIISKLAAANRGEAIAMAIARGIIFS